MEHASIDSTVNSPEQGELIPKTLTIETDTSGKSDKQLAANNVPTNETKKEQKLCPHYRKNVCRFGVQGKGCPFNHPERCQKLMHHGTRSDSGCNKGQKCEKFHPKMCQSSLTKNECLDRKCQLAHVRGTRRVSKPPDPKPAIAKVPLQDKASDKSEDVPNKSNDRTTSNKPTEPDSFLELRRLIREELLEAMDTKIATAISQIPQIQHPMPYQQHPMPYQQHPMWYYQQMPLLNQHYFQIPPLYQPQQPTFPQPQQFRFPQV